MGTRAAQRIGSKKLLVADFGTELLKVRLYEVLLLFHSF